MTGQKSKKKSFVSFFTGKPFLWFLLPGTIIYSIFVIYPIFAAGRLSMYQWNGISDKVFVGFNNYVELFTNPDLIDQMLNALKHNIILFVLVVLIQMPIQIIMAYTIFSKARGSNYFQVAIFSPQFISTPVIVFLFTLIFDGNIGLFNEFLRNIGLGEATRSWLGVPQFGVYIIFALLFWAGIGVGMMYFIGAMKMISTETLESAYMDGAGYWRRLWHIVLPQIKTTIINLVLVSYIVCMTVFDFNYLLGGTEGGINRSVDTMSLFFYRMAFGDANPLGGNVSANSIGMGTTVAVVLFMMIFVVALLQILLVYRKEED